ncbi:hypothetical protein F53441_14698, partial [Fusarium austroafricanum]
SPPHSPLPMALDCFFKFPYLPSDLRLMIWEAALRPSYEDHTKNQIRSGLHYFFIEGIENANRLLSTCKTRCYSPRYIEKRNTVKEVSAYLWDYGMWGACTESRRVINTQFRKGKWRQFANDILVEQRLRGPAFATLSHAQLENAWRDKDREKNTKAKGEVDKDGGDDGKDENQGSHREDWYHDLSTVIHYGENFSAATQPMKDLFIFGDTRWPSGSPLYGGSTNLYTLLTLFFRDVTVSPSRKGFPTVANLGFFYNDKWAEGIRLGEPHWPFTTEMWRANPRGQFLLILYLCILRGFKTKLWLIDVAYTPISTCQARHQAEKTRQVFYSYNEEYVEVDMLILRTPE